MKDESQVNAPQLITVDDFYKQNPLEFPSIDLFFLGNTDISVLLPTIAEAILGFHNETGLSPIREWVILLPIGRDDIDHLRDKIIKMIALSGRFEAHYLPSVRIVETQELSFDAAITLTQLLQPQSVFVVCRAALFRSEDVAPYQPDPSVKLALAEDLWAPQLLELTKRLMVINQTTRSYLVLDVGKYWPRRKSLCEPFLSLKGIGIAADFYDIDPEALVAAKMGEWSNLIACGRVGAVLQSIDTLPPILDSEKTFLRVQVLYSAGLLGLAFEEIEKLNPGENTRVFATLKLARISAEAGAIVQASKLLEKVVDKLDSIEEFEIATAAAQDIGITALLQRVSAKYDSRYPETASAKHRNFQKLLAAGNYAMACDAIPETQKNSNDWYVVDFLRQWLSEDRTPDYAVAARELARSNLPWADQALAAMARDALRRGLLVHAFELVAGIFRPPIPLNPHQFVEILERLLLNADGNGMAVDEERLAAPVREAVGYLARHPQDNFLRVRLEYVLSSAISGRKGIALLITTILNLINSGMKLWDRPSSKVMSLDELWAQKEFLHSAFSWLEAESPVAVGRLSMPESMVPPLVDSLTGAVGNLLLHIGGKIDDESQVDEIMQWLALGTSLVPHTNAPNQDLEMIRLAAGRFAVAGRAQRARDLIQLILESAGDSAVRQRTAWYAVADIYHRLRQYHECLLSIGCASFIDCEVESAQAVGEADLLSRLFRDIGFLEFAIQAQATVATLLKRLGKYESQKILHELGLISIEFAQLLRNPDRQLLEVLDLLRRCSANATLVMQSSFDPLPVTMLFGQMLRAARSWGMTIPANYDNLLTSLVGTLSGSGRTLVKPLTEHRPTGADVFALHQQTKRARYAEDAAFDTRAAVIAANHLLGDPNLSSIDAALAIELLSDRAISPPGWETTPIPIHPLSNIDDAAQMATYLSGQGLDIVLIGLDEHDVLVTLRATEGKLEGPNRASVTSFSGTGFRHWAKHYPYKYGIPEEKGKETPNLFLVSTESLCFPAPLIRQTLVIAATELQQFPPNLLRVEYKFAGQLKPIASAPSLSWLYHARKIPARTDGRLLAWIPPEISIGMTRDRLNETFQLHGVVLDCSNKLPEEFWGAELAIIVAHGGIFPDGRFFHTVSDEGDLTVSAAKFARSFKNVAVVILFVCSGGRADKHPAAETTVGLSKDLLAQGVTAVIGSPWPIDPRMSAHWLPTFLDEWKGGATIAEANFTANAHVSKYFTYNPESCLAMNVFGDPLRRYVAN